MKMCELFKEKSHHHRKKLAVDFILSLTRNDLIIKGDIMSFSLDTTQDVIVTVEPIDALGRKASYQPGSIVFTSSDATVLTTLPEVGNELSALLTAIAVGTVTLSYTGINLAGNLFNGSTIVTVTSALATCFNVSF